MKRLGNEICGAQTLSPRTSRLAAFKQRHTSKPLISGIRVSKKDESRPRTTRLKLFPAGTTQRCSQRGATGGGCATERSAGKKLARTWENSYAGEGRFFRGCTDSLSRLRFDCINVALFELSQ
jgi:hypothetical protein